jgi:hypothetical protein
VTRLLTSADYFAVTGVAPARPPRVRSPMSRKGMVCSIPDCGAAVYARGWCSRHYARNRMYGSPTAPDRRLVAKPKQVLVTLPPKKALLPVVRPTVEPTDFTHRVWAWNEKRLAREALLAQPNQEFRRLLDARGPAQSPRLRLVLNATRD